MSAAARPGAAENEQMVRALFTCMSGKDYDGALACLDEQVEWRFMFSEGAAALPLIGQAAVRAAVFEGADGVFRKGDPRIVVDTIIASGAMVMAETHGVGERTDGRSYVNKYAWAFEFRDGMIVKVREYMDTLYITDFMDYAGTQ